MFPLTARTLKIAEDNIYMLLVLAMMLLLSVALSAQDRTVSSGSAWVGEDRIEMPADDLANDSDPVRVLIVGPAFDGSLKVLR